MNDDPALVRAIIQGDAAAIMAWINSRPCLPPGKHVSGLKFVGERGRPRKRCSVIRDQQDLAAAMIADMQVNIELFKQARAGEPQDKEKAYSDAAKRIYKSPSFVRRAHRAQQRRNK